MHENSLFLNKLEKIGIDRSLVINLFSNLGLPIPKKDQFFTTSDDGVMIFLNEAGVVLRLGSNQAKNSCHVIRHKDIIQPIVQFDHDKLHMEILPGLRLDTDYNDAKCLVDRLKQDGLLYLDREGRIENIGYLPDGRAIVLDRNAFQIGAYSDKDILDDELPLAHTRQLLSKVFMQSIPVPFSVDNEQNNAHSFWDACKKMKDQGQLCAGWLDSRFADIIYYHSHGQTSQAQKASITYGNAVADYQKTLIHSFKRQI